MLLKNRISEILSEIKSQAFLSKEEQEKLLRFLSQQKINEGDAGKLVRLNNAAFSVRKKNNKLPALLRIMLDILEENVELRALRDKMRNAVRE